MKTPILFKIGVLLQAVILIIIVFCGLSAALNKNEDSPAIVMPTPEPTAFPVATVAPFEPMAIEFTVVDCHKTIASNAMGEPIVLCENKLAVNPTKAELEAFLNNDLTDEIPYAAPEWTCADYVREVHNNAELAGIKAYMVGVMPKSTSQNPHALLAVDTTDNGTVYVDCMYDAWVWVKAGSVMVYTNLRPTVYFDEQEVYEVKEILIIK